MNNTRGTVGIVIKDYQKQSYETRQLERAFRQLGVTPTLIAETELERVAECASILIRSGAETQQTSLNSLQAHQNSGVRFVNSVGSSATARDKLLFAHTLEAAGIPHPRTLPIEAEEDVVEASRDLGERFVMKARYGTEGSAVFLARSADQARRIYEVNQGLPLIAQQFVDASGTDFRVPVISGQDRLPAMRREARDGGWIANASRGARCSVAQGEGFLSYIGSLARDTAEAIGTIAAGIDVIVAQSGKALVLEANASLGFRHWDRITRAYRRQSRQPGMAYLLAKAVLAS